MLGSVPVTDMPQCIFPGCGCLAPISILFRKLSGFGRKNLAIQNGNTLESMRTSQIFLIYIGTGSVIGLRAKALNLVAAYIYMRLSMIIRLHKTSRFSRAIMLLKIQQDESLRSYIERNIYLELKERHVDVFKKIPKYSISSSNVRTIASELGWKGCYGFNRLIHYHTEHCLRIVFCDFKDPSYSGKSYILNGGNYSPSSKAIGFCPKCVNEDINRLGFSYWRRFHCDGAKVCSKHNVILLKKCPFCGDCFSLAGHGHNVMWATCEGRHLSECAPTPNCDSMNLKRAEFLEAVSKFNSQICERTASDFLFRKIYSSDCFRTLRTDGSKNSKNSSIYEFVRHFQDMKNGAERYKVDSSLLFDLAVTLYSRFEEFVVDLQSVNCEFRYIESGWATFKAAGNESPHYVEEDYALGVAQWSCPYPSEDSRKRSSTDEYWSRKPMVYRCCNFVSDCSKDLNLKSVRVRLAPPAVPRLGMNGKSGVAGRTDTNSVG